MSLRFCRTRPAYLHIDLLHVGWLKAVEIISIPLTAPVSRLPRRSRVLFLLSSLFLSSQLLESMELVDVRERSPSMLKGSSKRLVVISMSDPRSEL